MVVDEARKTLRKRVLRENEDVAILLAIEVLAALEERCPTAFSELVALRESDPDFVCGLDDDVPDDLCEAVAEWATKHGLMCPRIVTAAAEIVAYGSPGVPSRTIAGEIDSRHTYILRFNPFHETPRDFQRRATQLAEDAVESLKKRGYSATVLAQNRHACDYLVENRVNHRTLSELACGDVSGLRAANGKGIETRMNQLRQRIGLKARRSGRPRKQPRTIP